MKVHKNTEELEKVKKHKTINSSVRIKKRLKGIIQEYNDKDDLSDIVLQSQLITLLDQLDQLDKIKKEVKKQKVTSTKEYVKGRENIVINPLEKFLGETQSRKDKTINTIVKILKDLNMTNNDSTELLTLLNNMKQNT